MPSVLEKIALHAVVPALVLEDAEKAEPLGHALLDGGLPPVAGSHILRTPAALKALQTKWRRFPDLLVGAGTVLGTSPRPSRRSMPEQSSSCRPA